MRKNRLSTKLYLIKSRSLNTNTKSFFTSLFRVCIHFLCVKFAGILYKKAKNPLIFFCSNLSRTLLSLAEIESLLDPLCDHTQNLERDSVIAWFSVPETRCGNGVDSINLDRFL